MMGAVMTSQFLSLFSATQTGDLHGTTQVFKLCRYLEFLLQSSLYSSKKPVFIETFIFGGQFKWTRKPTVFYKAKHEFNTKLHVYIKPGVGNSLA